MCDVLLFPPPHRIVIVLRLVRLRKGYTLCIFDCRLRSAGFVIYVIAAASNRRMVRFNRCARRAWRVRTFHWQIGNAKYAFCTRAHTLSESESELLLLCIRVCSAHDSSLHVNTSQPVEPAERRPAVQPLYDIINRLVYYIKSQAPATQPLKVAYSAWPRLIDLCTRTTLFGGFLCVCVRALLKCSHQNIMRQEGRCSRRAIISFRHCSKRMRKVCAPAQHTTYPVCVCVTSEMISVRIAQRVQYHLSQMSVLPAAFPVQRH